MSFQTEPSFTHGQPPKTAVLLCNLGTPDEPTAPALRRYWRSSWATRAWWRSPGLSGG